MGAGAAPEQREVQLPDANTPSNHAGDGLSLPIGTRIAEFEILERIGEGGFSIVYLAMDHSLERTVALKEYMPSSLAARVSATQVQPRSSRYRDTFEAGLKSFVNEAKLLAQFDHPALVKVYRFWESNGTAYMVMPYYQGMTLKDAVRALPAAADEAWLMGLLAPLTEALMVIHAERCFHRDIAPDNVLLLAGSGKPLLLDFGAARRVIGDMTQALTVILKPGYAPIEQYAEVPGMKQGPWTDVYALAALVYWAVTGKTPPASVGRMMSDSFVPLAECAAGRYRLEFLQAIDRALVVLPERRTPSIEAFRLEIGLTAQADSGVRPAIRANDPDATVIRTAPSGPALSKGSVPTPDSPNTAQRTGTLPGKANGVSDTRSARGPLIFAGAAVAAAMAAAGIWLALPTPGQEHAPGTQEAAAARTRPDPPAANQDRPAAIGPSVPAQSPPDPLGPSARPAAEPTPSTATAGPKTAVRRPIDPDAAAPEKPALRSSKPERRPTEAAAGDECARIAHQLSLGESSPELIARLETLKCR